MKTFQVNGFSGRKISVSKHHNDGTSDGNLTINIYDNNGGFGSAVKLDALTASVFAAEIEKMAVVVWGGVQNG